MNKKFINELITELSYRILNGLPDLTNNDHLIILRRIMEEKGLSYDLIEKTMKNLRTPVKKNPNTINPIGFSVDFDGVHSDQAESMPYIDAYKPQDRADPDKLPMDGRDEDERDTPVDELDYLNGEKTNEDDIVKKKEPIENNNDEDDKQKNGMAKEKEMVDEKDKEK